MCDQEFVIKFCFFPQPFSISLTCVKSSFAEDAIETVQVVHIVLRPPHDGSGRHAQLAVGAARLGEPFVEVVLAVRLSIAHVTLDCETHVAVGTHQTSCVCDIRAGSVLEHQPEVGAMGIVLVWRECDHAMRYLT